MGDLAKLPNIGAEMERQLNGVGIATAEELARRGAKQAWLDILATDTSACYNRLCGLEGAVRRVRWHSLPQPVKDDLKRFYQAHRPGKQRG